ncbi:hypothetical protein BDN67DRAFT_1014111 [Paxillus ammoniavirescens]|nr:hypothetical protein BDN67DRAFT_1014111 [Paxillus ammoniavirescens]
MLAIYPHHTRDLKDGPKMTHPQVHRHAKRPIWTPEDTSTDAKAHEDTKWPRNDAAPTPRLTSVPNGLRRRCMVQPTSMRPTSTLNSACRRQRAHPLSLRLMSMPNGPATMCPLPLGPRACQTGHIDPMSTPHDPPLPEAFEHAEWA